MRGIMTTGAAMAAVAGMVLSREVGVDILLDDTDPRPPLDLSPDLYGGGNRADRRSSFKMTSTRNYNFDKNRAAAKAARAARKKTRRAK